MSTTAPAVTVILPTFNREAFLPGAFESLARQSFTNWNLIVVDDGSTDNTCDVVAGFQATLGSRLRCVRQENRGAYAARNRGLDEADGQYVAFFDSDDLWLPHHLERCVAALDEHQDVDWVFGSCRLVDTATGRTLAPSTFYIGDKPRPFLALQTRAAGALRIIDDPRALECQILHGLYCGLQNSMMRRRLFDGRRFDASSRVVDDELFVIRLLAERARFAYFDDAHVVYNVHSDNSSASATRSSLDKHVQIYGELASGLEQLLTELPLSGRERRALLRRLGREYFWHLGYVGYWQSGRRLEAVPLFKQGLAAWPWNAAAWKTYLLARFKLAVQGVTG